MPTYEFTKDTTAKFKFRTDQDSTATTTLAGINATLPSADSICAGVAALMAIGGNQPVFGDIAVRTVNENVEYY